MEFRVGFLNEGSVVSSALYEDGSKYTRTPKFRFPGMSGRSTESSLPFEPQNRTIRYPYDRPTGSGVKFRDLLPQTWV